MNKILVIIPAIFVTILIVVFANFSNMDETRLSKTLLVDAVYYDNGNYIEITYNDTSKETNTVTLEILGMPDSFQKQFTGSSFVEKVSLDYFPKYGWASIPVTFVVDHEEFGMIGIKTEIHSYGEFKPRVIYSAVYQNLL